MPLRELVADKVSADAEILRNAELITGYQIGYHAYLANWLVTKCTVSTKNDISNGVGLFACAEPSGRRNSLGIGCMSMANDLGGAFFSDCAYNYCMLIDQYYFVLEINKGEEPLVAEEPSDYLYTVTGNLVGLGEDVRRTIAGRFKLKYLDVSPSFDSAGAIFEVFDSEQSTVEYHSAIFSPGTGHFSEKLITLLDDDLLWGGVLILDRLEILPKFRGMGLGLFAMRRLIQRFGIGASIVAIKPFPLQHELDNGDVDRWEERMKLGDLEKNKKRATAALQRYYKKLGFKAMKGTPYMFRSTAIPLPSLSELTDGDT